jgi:hypothetical protein
VTNIAARPGQTTTSPHTLPQWHPGYDSSKAGPSNSSCARPASIVASRKSRKLCTVCGMVFQEKKKVGPGFGQHFYDELKTQLGRAERSEQNSTMLRDESKIFGNKKENAHMSEAEAAKENNSDAAWQDIQRRTAEPPKQHFMAEYMEALRAQMRNDKSSK